MNTPLYTLVILLCLLWSGVNVCAQSNHRAGLPSSDAAPGSRYYTVYVKPFALIAPRPNIRAGVSARRGNFSALLDLWHGATYLRHSSLGKNLRPYAQYGSTLELRGHFLSGRYLGLQFGMDNLRAQDGGKLYLNRNLYRVERIDLRRNRWYFMATLGHEWWMGRKFQFDLFAGLGIASVDHRYLDPLNPVIDEFEYCREEWGSSDCLPSAGRHARAIATLGVRVAYVFGVK